MRLRPSRAVLSVSFPLAFLSGCAPLREPPPTVMQSPERTTGQSDFGSGGTRSEKWVAECYRRGDRIIGRECWAVRGPAFEHIPIPEELDREEKHPGRWPSFATAWAPKLSLGERWSRSDGTLEVGAESPEGYILRLNRNKEYHVTRDGSLIRTVLNGVTIVEYSPPYPLIVWPLQVGKTWRYAGLLKSRLTGFEGLALEDFLVEAVEDLRLPLGSVPAFRIQSTYSTYWYAPTLRTIVKRVPRATGNPLLERFELVAVSAARPVDRHAAEREAGSPKGKSKPTPQAERSTAAVPRKPSTLQGRVEPEKLRPRDIAKAALESVVLLVFALKDGASLSQGSGFFVARDYVLTNYHVVKDAVRGIAKVVGDETTHDVGAVVAKDEGRDLAVLRIEGTRAPPLGLATTDGAVAIGDEIYVAGNPRGLEGSFSKGNVAAIRESGGVRVLQITAPISRGSSGGPVLNDQGEVVGIVTLYLRDAQNLNFAVDVSEARKFLKGISLR